jgi:hypothetical protein
MAKGEVGGKGISETERLLLDYVTGFANLNVDAGW